MAHASNISIEASATNREAASEIQRKMQGNGGKETNVSEFFENKDDRDATSLIQILNGLKVKVSMKDDTYFASSIAEQETTSS